MQEIMNMMKNRYWVLRHGRSFPNEVGLIVSHMSNGVLPKHGLSPGGIEQAREAGHGFLKEIGEENIAIDDVRVYCSPFSRTMDTAKAVADVMSLDTSKFQYCEDLRERYFGPTLELKSHEHYPMIWALDEQNPLIGPDGGESVADVATRLHRVIQQIEMECQGAAVLIVSHGDPLQILQTIIHPSISSKEKSLDSISVSQRKEIFDASVLSQHRKFALLTAELRRII